jgi:hypothetical protein
MMCIAMDSPLSSFPSAASINTTSASSSSTLALCSAASMTTTCSEKRQEEFEKISRSALALKLTL